MPLMILMVQTDQMGEVAYVFAACDGSVYGRAEKPRTAEITGRGAAQLRVTFDAEVVVRFACQLASPGSRLQ